MLVRRALAIAAVAALSIAVSCVRREPATLAGSSVVLVTIDTLRADRVGAYGYPPATTPNIDALARSGIRFDNAMAGAPLTLPSHATILTGRHPHRHGLRNIAAGSLSDEAHNVLGVALALFSRARTTMTITHRGSASRTTSTATAAS